MGVFFFTKNMPDEVLLLPFSVVRAPNLKLKIPQYIIEPSAMAVFGVVFFSYFLFLSGIIHDVITETPSVGAVRDPHTGAIRPQAILPGRINGQYIIEGLSAGFLFCVGAIGFVILDKAVSKQVDSTVALCVGILLVLVAYNISILFLRIKVPGYLR